MYTFKQLRSLNNSYQKLRNIIKILFDLRHGKEKKREIFMHNFKKRNNKQRNKTNLAKAS